MTTSPRYPWHHTEDDFKKDPMKEKCTCGFIINVTGRGWLLAHPTNGGNRWDFPKGGAEEGEHHLKAALRELREETGIDLQFESEETIDLGQHSYQKDRDMHLFYIEVDELDTKALFCESMVINKNGPDYPEMDAFAIFPIEKVSSKVGTKMDLWIKANVPTELRKGY